MEKVRHFKLRRQDVKGTKTLFPVERIEETKCGV